MDFDNKKERKTYIIERDKYLRVDLEYPEFSSFKGPFDRSKKVNSVVDKAISKASSFYPIIKRVFSSAHSGLSDALASVLESLDTLKESLNEGKRSN